MAIYYPAIKLKKGEYSAISKLPDEICDRFEPRLIVPPPKSTDPEKGRSLTPEEISYDVGKRIGQHWLTRTAYLDIQYVQNSLSPEELVRLVKKTKEYNKKIVQLISLDGPDANFYSATNLVQENTHAIIVNHSDFELYPEKISQRLSELSLNSSQTICFVDFTGADMSNSEIATQSVIATIERIMKHSVWKKIVFQASNFPAKYPEEELKVHRIPRTEWTTYQNSLKMLGIANGTFAYGDFGSDRDEQTFPNSRAPAVKHLRYTSTNFHNFIRGSANGTYPHNMRQICELITASDFFDGRDFSYADEIIFQLSKGMRGPGNATDWREWNTARHISKTVFDLSQTTENPITAKLSKHEEQLSLQLK